MEISDVKLTAARFMALIKKYLKVTVRNKQNLFWIFGYPLLFMGLFALAFQGGGRSDYDIVVINRDDKGIENPASDFRSMASQNIEELFEGENKFTESFNRVEEFSNGTKITEQEAIRLLENENIDGLIVIPENFTEVVLGSTWWYKAGKSGTNLSDIEYLSNDFKDLANGALSTTNFPSGSPKIEIKSVADTVTQTVVRSIFQGVVNDIVLYYNNASQVSVDFEVQRVTFTFDAYDYLSPGFVGVGVLVAISNIATMFALDKSKGIMRRLDTTPVPRSTQLLSGGAAQFLFSAVQIVILLACLPLFGANSHPNADWFLAFVVALSLSFTCIGLGLIIAAIAKDSDSAGGLSWIFILPLQFLGGGFFSMQDSVAKYVPSFYSINGLRKVLVYGLGWADVYTDVLINLGFGAAFIAVGLFIFSKKNRL